MSIYNNLVNKEYEDDNEENYHIDVMAGCSLKKVKYYCLLHKTPWIDTILSENYIGVYKQKWLVYCKRQSMDNIIIDVNAFDENTLIDIITRLELYRIEILSALHEYGVNEVDSHFLSIKVLISIIKKFRGTICESFNVNMSRETYHRTFLRPSFIFLLSILEQLIPKKTYLYSKKAVETISYRQEFSKACATLLTNETSAIITAKLMV